MRLSPRAKAAGLLFALSLIAFSVGVVCLSAGCQNGAVPTTQPSLATTTTGVEAALDIAVNVIHVGVDLKLIDGPTYWRDLDPAVVAGQAAAASMRAHANAAYAAEQSGDASTAAAERSAGNVASDAVLAAVAQLQPYVQRVQAAAAKPKGAK